MKTQYANEGLSRTTIYPWHAFFAAGRTSARSGWLKTSSMEIMVNTVKAIIMEDQYLMVRELGATLHICQSSVQNILSTKLKMKCVLSVWVPYYLIMEQFAKWVSVCHEWKEELQKDQNMLKKVINCNKIWAYHHNPYTECRRVVWKHQTHRRRKWGNQRVSAKSCLRLSRTTVAWLAYYSCRYQNNFTMSVSCRAY